MGLKPEVVQAYLDRIGIPKPPEPTAENLRRLQRAHLLTVPFENLDISIGKTIRLEEDVLVDKIIRRRRGGFCFELNGLFALLLQALGFPVDRLSASSANDDGTYLKDFEHLALLVTAEDDPHARWLVDVGWGDGPIEPLRMVQEKEQRRGGQVYRIQPEDRYLVLEEQTIEGTWIKHYRFDLVPHVLAEFEGMCEYMQSSPESMFTQKRLCTIFRKDGRDTLTNLRLICSRGEGLRGSMDRQERELASEEEAQQLLRELFGIGEEG